MSAQVAEWSGPEGRGSVLSILPVARKEIARRPLMLFGMFAVIALGSLASGILLPKKYTSTTTILVEESNIIAPLMEGRAVPTGVAKRASIAREVAFSRRVMNEILQVGGWLEQSPDPLRQERLIDQITDRTHISTPRDNLIQIAYTDSDPERSFEVTKRFADLVIEESLATKSRESRDAYEFINSQVTQYHRKLTEAESKLEQYRQANPDARAGIESDVNTRIGELRRQVETARMELLDLQSPGRRAAGAAFGRKRGRDGADPFRPASGPLGRAEKRTRPTAADLHRPAPGCDSGAAPDPRPRGRVDPRGCTP